MIFPFCFLTSRILLRNIQTKINVSTTDLEPSRKIIPTFILKHMLFGDSIFHYIYVIKICKYFANNILHITIIVLQLFKSIILMRKEILLQTMSRWSDYNIQIMSIATNTQSLSICGSVYNAINVGNRKSRARFINCTQLQNIHQQ